MRRVGLGVGCVVMALALVACSGGRDKARSPTSRNVRVPDVDCAVDPRQFAEAEKIKDFGNGHACGVRNAWRLSSINGVRLSQPAVVNCAVANTMSQWITQSLQPAAESRLGERVTEITVPSAYACRTRNSVRGAKISEHAFGNAMDVSGFKLESGDYVAVEQGWFGGRKVRKFLAQIRGAACGPFKTVLGPGTDSHHADHLHFDLKPHRNGGAYCR